MFFRKIYTLKINTIFAIGANVEVIVFFLFKGVGIFKYSPEFFQWELVIK